MSFNVQESIERTVSNKVIDDVVKDAEKILYTISASQSTGSRCKKSLSTMVTCKLATKIPPSRSSPSLSRFDSSMSKRSQA